MPFHLHWSTRARRDLIRVLKYCGESDPDWAIAIDAAITERLEALVEDPFISSFVRRTYHGEVREVLVDNYRLHFSVTEEMNQITLIEIRHVRQADPDFEE